MEKPPESCRRAEETPGSGSERRGTSGMELHRLLDDVIPGMQVVGCW